MDLVWRWRDYRCHPAAEVTAVSSQAAAAGSQRAQSRGGAMAWLMLVTAGLFETGFAVFLKLSHGLTKFWPTAGFAVCALISFGLLTLALRQLEVGPAYAVWTGIGAAGAAAVGMIVLGDPVTAVKLTAIGLILAGVVGLNLSGVTP
jgi:quaternary ammonium compound-resistance protein SugE